MSQAKALKTHYGCHVSQLCSSSLFFSFFHFASSSQVEKTNLFKFHMCMKKLHSLALNSIFIFPENENPLENYIKTGSSVVNRHSPAEFVLFFFLCFIQEGSSNNHFRIYPVRASDSLSNMIKT